MNKRKCELRHVSQRYTERVGVAPSRALITDLINQIQTGEAEFIRKQSNRVTIWRVPHDGSDLKVVYDKQRKMVVTVMPFC